MKLLTKQGALALAALLFGFIPLLGWVASVIIGVATFELGTVAGGIVSFFAAIPYLVHGIAGDKIAYFSILFSCFYIWAMAEVLKKTASWSAVLNLSILMGLIIVNALHIALSDIYIWWYHYCFGQLKVISELLNDIGLEITDLSNLTGVNLSGIKSTWSSLVGILVQRGVIMSWTQIMTGLVITSTMLGNLFNLWVARWWHQKRVGKKNAGRELCFIRLHWLLAIYCLLALALFKITPIAKDNFTAVCIVLFFGGISLMHWFVLQQKWLIIGLIVFYIVLVLYAKPVLIFVTLLAIIDALLDVRKNVGKLCHNNERGK